MIAESKQSYLFILLTVIFGCFAPERLHAVTVVTWGSTVDDGDLEFTLGVGAITANESTLGSGILGPDVPDVVVGDPNLQIAGGEIVYATSPNNTVDDVTTAIGAINDEQFFQFSFTVGGLSAGQTLAVDRFSYSTRRNWFRMGEAGWGESQVAVRVGDSGFSPADLIGGVNIDPAVGDVDSFALTNDLPTGLGNGDVVNFRIYAWGTDATGGGNFFNASTRLGAVAVEGTVTAIPEPAHGIFLATFAMASATRRRRR